MPDAEYRCGDGNMARLYSVLGPAWSFLGPEALGALAKMRLNDVAMLPANGDGFLVRPDGHLAWRGSDPRQLTAWLNTALGRPGAVNAVWAQ